MVECREVFVMMMARSSISCKVLICFFDFVSCLPSDCTLSLSCLMDFLGVALPELSGGRGLNRDSYVELPRLKVDFYGKYLRAVAVDFVAAAVDAFYLSDQDNMKTLILLRH